MAARGRPTSGLTQRQPGAGTTAPGPFLSSLRAAISGLLATLVFVALVILADFQHRQAPDPLTTDTASIAIVFTGQFDRIETALNLFDQGRVKQLFISGVGPGSGLRPETLADQFDFSPRARAALQSGEILLSPDAIDTFDNAAETACWLRTQPAAARASVILVTSVSHMPRASITLERALPAGTRVHRISPPETDLDRAAQRVEQGKFVYSWIATLFPASRDPAAYLALCGNSPTP